MSDTDTIPADVRYEFEKFTINVCEQAKIDYADIPEWVAEHKGALERRWRQYNKMSFPVNVEAVQNAIKKLGSVESFATDLQGGPLDLWSRLLMSRRYGSQRILLTLAFGMLHAALVMDHSVIVDFLNGHMTCFLGDESVYKVQVDGLSMPKEVSVFLGSTPLGAMLCSVGLALSALIPQQLRGRFVVFKKSLATVLVIATSLLMFSHWFRWNPFVVQGRRVVEPLADSTWEHIVTKVEHAFVLMEPALFSVVLLLIFAEIYDFGEMRRETLRKRQNKLPLSKQELRNEHWFYILSLAWLKWPQRYLPPWLMKLVSRKGEGKTRSSR